jgi:hypothetical protein
MLRFDCRWNALFAGPLDCHIGCRVTKPGRDEDRRSGLSPQALSARRAGQAAVRSDENATRKRVLAEVELDSPIRMRLYGPAAPLRHGPSATGFRLAYHNARAEG